MAKSKKVIIVTGASSGIGLATAKLLAKQGYTVFGGARSFDSKLKQHHEFWCYQLDITNADSVSKFTAVVLSKSSQVDVLINNAGAAIMGAVEDTSVEQAKVVFETNVFGWQRMIQAVLPIMRKQKSGYIINISSIAGQFGLPFRGWYSASKFALEGLTESLRLEVEPFGIKITSVQPGDVKTEIGKSRLVAEKAGVSDYKEAFDYNVAHIDGDVHKGLNVDEVAKHLARLIATNNPPLRLIIGNIIQTLAVAANHIVPNPFFKWIIKTNYKMK